MFFMSNTKRIFICSRLRGRNQQQLDHHIKQARQFAAYTVKENLGAPFVPHLLYPQFLDDTDDFQRRMGIEAGLAYLNVCDAIYAFLDEDGFVSDGMRHEIQYASDHGVPIHVFQLNQGRLQVKDSLLASWKNDWLDVRPL